MMQRVEEKFFRKFILDCFAFKIVILSYFIIFLCSSVSFLDFRKIQETYFFFFYSSLYLLTRSTFQTYKQEDEEYTETYLLHEY